jgi:hypothetical protein
MKEGGQYGDQEVQRVVDIVAQFELEVGMEQPPLYEEDRIRAMLRARWGAYHDQRLAKVNAYVNSRPALKAYLNRTGAGNRLSVLEALGMIADGTMAVSPARAQELMDEQRRNPKSPLRDPFHKGHGLAVQQAKVLADIIDRGERKKNGRQGSVEELVADRQAAEAKAKGKKPADDAMAKLDDEIQKIRMDPQYFKSGPASKVLHERMRELMRQRWPE